jgi:hypothetical protein
LDGRYIVFASMLLRICLLRHRISSRAASASPHAPHPHLLLPHSCICFGSSSDEEDGGGLSPPSVRRSSTDMPTDMPTDTSRRGDAGAGAGNGKGKGGTHGSLEAGTTASVSAVASWNGDASSYGDASCRFAPVVDRRC